MNAIPEPIRVCPDTWLIPQLEQAPPVGCFFLNSAVITGAEPIVVDTGTPVNRTQWLEHLGSIVDPADVRWIFLSHDDVDHAGNLALLMDLCPHAVLLTSWFAVGRMVSTEGIALPMSRIRFVNDGDIVSVGDRRLQALLPPIFDNPTTRGIFDWSTGFYWAADCFGSPVSDFLPEADDVPAADWREGFLMLHRMLAPWHIMLDHRRYAAAVLDRLEALPISSIAGAHGPIVRGSRIPHAMRMMRELPHTGPLETFTQSDLQGWIDAACAPRHVDAATA
jgi:flavorubredoxin